MKYFVAYADGANNPVVKEFNSRELMIDFVMAMKGLKVEIICVWSEPRGTK